MFRVGLPGLPSTEARRLPRAESPHLSVFVSFVNKGPCIGPDGPEGSPRSPAVYSHLCVLCRG